MEPGAEGGRPVSRSWFVKTFASALAFAGWARLALSRAASVAQPLGGPEGGESQGQQAQEGRDPASAHGFPPAASSRAARAAISLASGAFGASRA